MTPAMQAARDKTLDAMLRVIAAKQAFAAAVKEGEATLDALLALEAQEKEQADAEG